MRERGKLLPSTATSYDDRMVKYSLSMEGKEGSWRECWCEFDGGQEVKVEEAWTKWAFSVFSQTSHLR